MVTLKRYERALSDPFTRGTSAMVDDLWILPVRLECKLKDHE